MKKLYLLSWLIAFVTIMSVNASHRLTEEERQAIENVQRGKIERQRGLARPAVYKMIDAVIKEETAQYENETLVESPISVNWPAIFNIIDSMQDVISVNEYRTYENDYPLLYIAVKQKNFSVAKILLEKYKANPNVTVMEFPSELSGLSGGMISTTPLTLARKKGDNAMVKLLMYYGAKK